MKIIEFDMSYYMSHQPKLRARNGQIAHIVAIRKNYITYTTGGRICVANIYGEALPKGQKDRSLMMVLEDEEE